MTPHRFSLPVDGPAAAHLCLAQRMPAGDPVRLRVAARRSGAFAAELRDSAGALLGAADSSLWRGPAHRAFTEQLRGRVPELTAAADRYDEYAGALADYAGALDVLVPALGAARRQLQQHSDESAGGDPAGVLLALARGFKARYDEWLDALDRCSRALLRAGEPDPAPHRHGWQAVVHAAGSVGGTFERAVLHPSLANISACLGELNTGLSVLGVGLLFVYPPAGAACLAAATVLAVAQLAVDSARRAHGEPVSNASLGFELAAAIPLGGSAVRSLKVADDVVHLVPGGGLAAHEAAGGHTLAKHVGKSEAFLRNRLATEPDIKGASTFHNRQIAEESIHSVLKANQLPINRWLAGTRLQLRLNARSSSELGVFLLPGSSVAVGASGIRVILRRTEDLGTGFYIHTAMVTE